MEYYPSPREELVEEALRKIACDQVKGVYLDDGAGVQFTLYELKKELKERGHDIDKADLVEALKICNLTNISIQTADGKALMQSAIFPTLLIASREDWLAAPHKAMRCTPSSRQKRVIFKRDDYTFEPKYIAAGV
jgi:hypothetical protein